MSRNHPPARQPVPVAQLVTIFSFISVGSIAPNSRAKAGILSKFFPPTHLSGWSSLPSGSGNNSPSTHSSRSSSARDADTFFGWRFHVPGSLGAGYTKPRDVIHLAFEASFWSRSNLPSSTMGTTSDRKLSFVLRTKVQFLIFESSSRCAALASSVYCSFGPNRRRSRVSDLRLFSSASELFALHTLEPLPHFLICESPTNRFPSGSSYFQGSARGRADR